MQNVWIVSACRTAIGNFGGSLSDSSVNDLAKIVLENCIKRANVEPSIVEEVIMGHVLQAGTGQGPARQAAIYAGMSESSSAFSVNNVCGSGLKSVGLAYSLIKAGMNDVIIAGGMENMSKAPFIINNIRFGNKLGDNYIRDTILCDGLIDSFEYYHMGITAEALANKYKISRKEQDEYAVESHLRAENAINNYYFTSEIVDVVLKNKKAKHKIFNVDEHCRPNINIKDIATLPPVFCKNGSITAANSSGLADGAAAVALASTKAINDHKLLPIAKIISCVSIGVDPKIMGLGAALSIEKILKENNLKKDDISLYEINEAFAAQFIAVIKYLNIDMNKINISGGAIALGHPLGASGARILVTLIYNLIRTDGKYGIASICVGGGMGVSILIEIC